MKRLILTGCGGGSDLARSGLAEIVIPFHLSGDRSRRRKSSRLIGRLHRRPWPG